MLPSTDELLIGLGFLALRHEVARPSPTGIDSALVEAEALAGEDERDEPPALFWVLARRPRALGALWPRAPGLVANGHAAQLGLPPAPEDELRALRMAIVTNQVAFPDVRAWFRAWYDRAR